MDFFDGCVVIHEEEDAAAGADDDDGDDEEDEEDDDDDEVEFQDKLAITYFHSRVTEYHSMSINTCTIQAAMHLKVN